MNEDKRIGLQIISDIVIAICTVVLAVVAYLQWRTMQITLDQAVHRGRAWLVHERGQLSSDLTATTPLSFSLFFKNVGESPALEVNGRWTRKVCWVSPDGKIASDCPDLLSVDIVDKEERYGIVGPDKGISSQFSFPLQPPYNLELLRTGKTAICFCGVITYRDVFCASHRKNLCWYYRLGEKEMPMCPTGNTEQDEQGECS